MCIEMISIKNLLEKKNFQKLIIIDIRDRKKYYKSHIPQSINIIGIENVSSFLRNVAGGKEVVLYCDRGVTSMEYVKELNKRGFCVKSLIGGFNSYQKFKH